MAITLVMVAIVFVGQIVLLKGYYEVFKKSEVGRIGNQVEELISKGLDDNAGNIISRLAYENDLCIEISDGMGTTLKTADMMGSGCVIHSIDQRALGSIKKELLKEPEKNRYYSINHPQFMNESMLYGKAIEVNGNYWILLINAGIEPIDGTTAILKKQLLWTTVFAILTSTIISSILSQKFTNPIKKLELAAKEVAKGNFDVKVDIESDDEIGDLANTFNYMTEEVSKVGSLQKDLIANVSHELRIPLTMIRGYAETIKDITGDDKEKRDKQLDIIIDETTRLNALVSDILSLGRIESGQEKIDPEEIPLKELIEGVMQKYTLLYSDYTFNVRCDFDGEVIADEGKITQVIMNLTNNAINHTGDDNTVNITVAEENEWIKVSVGDTGKGIPKEELSLIWDRYYKSEKSGKRRVAGTGLGLSIVKAIMIAHSAPFGVDSKIGEGSVFWFCLKKK